MPEIYESAGPLPWLAFQQRRTRRWLHTRLGIDHAIGFTILARVWSSAAGLVTVGLIARFLSPAEQGYYYTFGSLIALQIVFELGFSFVILQLATHERAHLTISPKTVRFLETLLPTPDSLQFFKGPSAGIPLQPFFWRHFF
jgi:hypothetical protein